MRKFCKSATLAVAVAALATTSTLAPTAAFAQTTQQEEARPRPWWVGSCSKLQWVLMPWMCGTIEIIYW